MDSIWPPLLLILGIIGSGASTPFYSIVAPKVVRPNSDYHVAVTISAASLQSSIHVELTGEQDSKEVFNVSQTATVEPNSTRIIKLEIGDTTPGKYKLTCRGLSGILFSNTTDLRFVHKRYSVFIQTDRSVYKPGSKVSFRVLVLKSGLLPAEKDTKLDIHISDGQGNRVKQWKPLMDGKGVFPGELQLSDSPALGNWKIVVKSSESQTDEKVFEVAEYVLPKFEVSIEVPKHATFKDSKLNAIVRAKYTYGKPVKGEATVTISTNRFWGYGSPSSPPEVKKVVPLDGKAIINVDLKDELRLTEVYQRTVEFKVTVEEALTGRTQNATAEMTLHEHKYTMELIKPAGSPKPGLKYTTSLKLAYHDGSPVQDQINPVQIWYGYSFDQSSYTNISKLLDKNGMIELDFYPPLETNNTYTPLNIEAEYLKLHQWFSAPNTAISRNGAYIQALLKTENPAVGKEIEIEVSSTVPLKYISYEILGHGDIVDAATIQLSETKTTSFKFTATHAMTPTAHLVISYLREDGEVVADSLDIQVDGTFQNFVNIETSPNVARPGESVDVIISSKPNSYVGLLGVDQSSLLLKSGNDISHEQVLKEIKSWDQSNEFSSWSFAYWRPSSSSAQEIWEKSGAVVMTNGWSEERYPLIYPLASFAGAGVAYASAAIPGPPGAPPQSFEPEKPKVRKNFPETWIWEMFDAQPDGRTVLKRSVPDTITSWVITGFSIDKDHGFGLIKEPKKLNVFQPFFISVNLPYSVVRDEIVALQFLLFNYMEKDLTAEVVLTNDHGQFAFAELSNAVQDTPNQDISRREEVVVKAGSGTSVSFLIIPKELGPIDIKATATSALAGDSIEEKLLVKAEGETQYKNKAIFVDLRNVSSLTTIVPVDIPENLVPGSERVEVSAVGDILGPSTSNLENLLQMPYGCGEQNMLNFVPDIVVINYLKSINQLTPAIHGKALKFLDVGYQRELTYRHDDGSFSAFGKSDPSGSTWLTAFVAKSFNQAAEHITIEDRIIKEALEWLATNQAANGSFPEVGRISHQAMQGGAAKGIALTAYTLITFLEYKGDAEKYKDTVRKGVDYLTNNLEGLDDVYSLAICTYVLNLAKHPQENVAFDMLQAKANQSEDYRWWSKPVPEDNENPWYSQPSSVNVEMTSYAMLTYLRRNMVAEALPIMKWLVSQRNSEGGFASTQDTVIGIYALSKLGEKIASGGSDISIAYTYGAGNQSNININSENNMILQKHTLPRETREVNVTATGTGFAVLQVSCSYNLNVPGAFPLFTLKPEVDKSSDANNLQLSVCAEFIPTKETNESNMAVMEVNLPSGFEVDMDSIPSLEKTEHVKRVETKNGDTMVVLYFDKMVQEEYCVKVSAFRAHKVAEQKPVPVSVYDYYDSTRKARAFYKPLATSRCDICEGDNCTKVCPAAAESVTTAAVVQTEA